MGWRTVVIGSRSKLDFKMNYMIVRNGSDIKKVYIDEIYMLLIESTAVSLTAVVLNELIKAKVKIVFCDEYRNPMCEVMPIYGSHNTSKRCMEQVAWTDQTKMEVWTEIVRRKIGNQAKLLERYGKSTSALLEAYQNELTLNDETQREGHAAKVYFNSLFGNSFSRDQDNNINAALNYGYAILLSAINREIVGMGYITQLGLCHHNQFNPYNLGSDFIEPLRGMVDKCVLGMDLINFDRDKKYELVSLLSEEVKIEGSKQLFSAAIRIYCQSLFNALREEDLDLIRFVEYEL